MRVALYARCSTTDQNPDAQLHQLREYAAARGLEVLEFVDHGVSGRKDRRPALDRLLARSIATMLEIGKGTVAREARRLRLAAA